MSIVLLSCSKDDSTPTPEPIAKYTVQFQTSTGGTVSTSGGSYEKGSKLTITAIPQEEYVFDSWSDGNTENPREIVVNSDINITAIFVKKSYPLSITLEGQGSVQEEVIVQGSTSSTNYNSGTVLKLTAIPDEGWEFTEWKGDINTVENPIELNINEGVNITAVFSELSTIVLDFYDIPEDQDFKHIFFSNIPGWNQYYDLEDNMFKKIILYNSADQVVGETLYKPEDNLRVELPWPTETGAHYLKEYLYFKDEGSEGDFQNTPFDNFSGGENYYFNFRYQYEIIFEDPIYLDTEVQYEINQRHDALLLVDKNVNVSKVGIGTTGFAGLGRHVYVNSDVESYPVRLYFDTYYIDKIVSASANSTTIIELSEDDILIDYPIDTTGLWENDPIYTTLKNNFDNGVENELTDFMNAFKSEAEEFNIDLGQDPILSMQYRINIDNIEYMAITENICGQTTITVSELFNELSFGQQVAVMYHEFGHAYFGYDHEEFGLMLPDVYISQFRNYTAIKGELARFFDQSEHSIIDCSGNMKLNPESVEGQKIHKVFLKL